MTAIDLAAPAAAGLVALAIGELGPSFDGLLGTDGRRHSLSDLADREAVVLIFSSNRCPTAKAYGPRMNALQAEFGPRGVALVAVNANEPHLYPDESYPRMLERAAEDGYTFPYVVDEGQRLARAFGASCTFHVFVLDRERRLRYQGRFDDARIPERVTSHDLDDALEDVLAGRAVRTPVTRPFGCSLDFV
jgi:peroxiredoxin